eukprot:bmy_13356T0
MSSGLSPKRNSWAAFPIFLCSRVALYEEMQNIYVYQSHDSAPNLISKWNFLELPLGSAR